MKRILFFLLILFTASALAQTNTPTFTFTPTPSYTNTPTKTNTPTATHTPTPIATPGVVATNTPGGTYEPLIMRGLSNGGRVIDAPEAADIISIPGTLSAEQLTSTDDATITDALSAASASITGGTLNVGVADTTRGLLTLKGAATGSTNGGSAVLETGDDHDAAIDSYSVTVSSANLLIGPVTDADRIKLSAAGNLTLTAGNMGIGNIVPTAMLSIGADLSTAYELMIGDAAADCMAMLGQSSSRFGGLRWDYNATAGNAYLAIETNSNLNDLLIDGLTTKIQTIKDGLTYVGSDLSTGYNAADDDDFIYFDQGNESISWDDNPGEFDFSDDLQVTGGVTTSGDADINGELYGAVMKEAFNVATYDTGTDGYANLTTGTLCTATRGLIVDRAGSIIGYGYKADTVTVGTAMNFEIRKNGVAVWTVAFANGVLTGNGTQAKGTDTFVAGDVLNVYIDTGVTDAIAVLDIWITYTRD